MSDIRYGSTEQIKTIIFRNYERINKVGDDLDTCYLITQTEVKLQGVGELIDSPISRSGSCHQSMIWSLSKALSDIEVKMISISKLQEGINQLGSGCKESGWIRQNFDVIEVFHHLFICLESVNSSFLNLQNFLLLYNW